ncbi:hypothetical protein CALCODRAFT_155490 [Calocera cornea HHB12733]|uniref:Uncharacterized protein n=1 Tax=Calocera cornea HHB12733 TaxID=1353952 RepID=A0A165CKV8_9BASI|nr:hypothetical protein CALCODRAFT_155490 [Calocera cornea HHB12733]
MNFSTPSREKASAVNVHPELSFLADVQWQAPTDLKAMDMHQTTSQVGPRASTAISIQSPQQPGMTPQEPPAHTHGNIVQPTPQNYETSENKHNTIKLIELEDHLSASTHASDELSWGSQQSEDISDILITVSAKEEIVPTSLTRNRTWTKL